MSGLELLACDDDARYVLSSMRCRRKCSDGCEFNDDIDMVEIIESEPKDAVCVVVVVVCEGGCCH